MEGADGGAGGAGGVNKRLIVNAGIWRSSEAEIQTDTITKRVLHIVLSNADVCKDMKSASVIVEGDIVTGNNLAKKTRNEMFGPIVGAWYPLLHATMDRINSDENKAGPFTSRKICFLVEVPRSKLKEAKRPVFSSVIDPANSLPLSIVRGVWDSGANPFNISKNITQLINLGSYADPFSRTKPSDNSMLVNLYDGYEITENTLRALGFRNGSFSVNSIKGTLDAGNNMEYFITIQRGSEIKHFKAIIGPNFVPVEQFREVKKDGTAKEGGLQFPPELDFFAGNPVKNTWFNENADAAVSWESILIVLIKELGDFLQVLYLKLIVGAYNPNEYKRFCMFTTDDVVAARSRLLDLLCCVSDRTNDFLGLGRVILQGLTMNPAELIALYKEKTKTHNINVIFALKTIINKPEGVLLLGTLTIPVTPSIKTFIESVITVIERVNTNIDTTEMTEATCKDTCASLTALQIIDEDGSVCTSSISLFTLVGNGAAAPVLTPFSEYLPADLKGALPPIRGKLTLAKLLQGLYNLDAKEFAKGKIAKLAMDRAARMASRAILKEAPDAAMGASGAASALPGASALAPEASAPADAPSFAPAGALAEASAPADAPSFAPAGALAEASATADAPSFAPAGALAFDSDDEASDKASAAAPEALSEALASEASIEVPFKNGNLEIMMNPETGIPYDNPVKDVNNLEIYGARLYIATAEAERGGASAAGSASSPVLNPIPIRGGGRQTGGGDDDDTDQLDLNSELYSLIYLELKDVLLDPAKKERMMQIFFTLFSYSMILDDSGIVNVDTDNIEKIYSKINGNTFMVSDVEIESLMCELVRQLYVYLNYVEELGFFAVGRFVNLFLDGKLQELSLKEFESEYMKMRTTRIATQCIRKFKKTNPLPRGFTIRDKIITRIMNLQQTEPVFYQMQIVPILIDSDNINKDITNVIDSWRLLADTQIGIIRAAIAEQMRDAAIAEQVRIRRKTNSVTKRKEISKKYFNNERNPERNPRKAYYNPAAGAAFFRGLADPGFVVGGFHKTRKSKSKSGKTRKVNRKN